MLSLLMSSFSYTRISSKRLRGFLEISLIKRQTVAAKINRGTAMSTSVRTLLSPGYSKGSERSSLILVSSYSK